MKRILDKPYMEGICPCCGSQIEYGQRNHMDNGGTINWECPNCEASGEEGYTPDNKANALLPKQNWCLEIYIVIIERGEKMEEQTTIKTLF